jgi:hypothetical protein
MDERNPAISRELEKAKKVGGAGKVSLPTGGKTKKTISTLGSSVLHEPGVAAMEVDLRLTELILIAAMNDKRRDEGQSRR